MTAFSIASLHGPLGLRQVAAASWTSSKGQTSRACGDIAAKARRHFKHFTSTKSNRVLSVALLLGLFLFEAVVILSHFLPVCLFAEFSLRLAFKSVLRQRLQRPFWHLHARRRPFH